MTIESLLDAAMKESLALHKGASDKIDEVAGRQKQELDERLSLIRTAKAKLLGIEKV